MHKPCENWHGFTPLVCIVASSRRIETGEGKKKKERKKSKEVEEEKKKKREERKGSNKRRKRLSAWEAWSPSERIKKFIATRV